MSADGVAASVLPGPVEPPAGATFLERVNPVAAFLAAICYSIPMLLTIDVVSALVGLAAGGVLLAIGGVRPIDVVRRAWPLFIAAPVSGISMLLYAEPSGRTYGSFWLAEISDGSIALALAVVLRVLAIGIPTLVVLVGVDATRLADGLAQIVRLPSRFVLGALAGIRLFTVFRDDWTAMAQARRARGLGDSGAVRRAFTMAFALLVLAIRRGAVLATAMEARGFGSDERTWARPSSLGVRDVVVVAAGLLVGMGAVLVAVATGSFRLLGLT